MDWDLVVKVAVPIATFFLGVLSTWQFKRYEERKALLRNHTQELSKLTNEWYNQLHEISNDAISGLKKRELRQRIDSYISNRLVLPKVILSLEVLRGFPEAVPLVREVDGFLGLITEYRQSKYEPYVCSLSCMDPLTNDGGHLEDILQELDQRLQGISAISAGILLGRNPNGIPIATLPPESVHVRRLTSGSATEGP